jgi:ubiquinone/menaquinone biosynthesis C-methylase UbiE
LIEHMWALEGVDAVPAFSNSNAEVRRVLQAGGRRFLTVPSAAPMTLEETERFAKAMRRALPVLVKIQRYERRAAARLDRANRALYS